MAESRCSITHSIAKEPVVSIKTGHVYEKQVIEEHLERDSTCPITNQPLSKDDLVPLQVREPYKPKANNLGVSDVISVFQDEWDSLMLESFNVKQNLEIVRKELSHALYQHDAACRTIARLIKEKEEAKKTYADLANQKAQSRRGLVNLPAEGAKEFPEQMIRDIYDVRLELSKMRRERESDSKAMLAYSSQEMILNYRLTTSVALHSEKEPGITCLDVNTDLDDLIVTGGKDGKVILYNRAQDKIINTFDKHSKPITAVKFVPGKTRGGRQALAISASEDGLGYAFVHNHESGEVTVTYKCDHHTDAITGCAVHPINYLVFFCSRDGSFSCHDLNQGVFLSRVTLDKDVPIRSMDIHPDGEITAFASQDGIVRIWNVPQLVQISQFQAHKGAIDSVSFSDDGKFLATSSYEEKTVKLWDLRRISSDNYRILNDAEGVITFDKTGKFLAVGAHSSLLLYNVRTAEQFTKIQAHQDRITSIKFGNQSKYIATTSLDNHLNIFS